MAITYINGTSGPNNVDGVILGVQSNLEFGSFNGHHQYSVPSASGLTPENTILGINEDRNFHLGMYDDQSLNRGARNLRYNSTPSGYSSLGVPTWGSGRINVNATLALDTSLSPSGSATYLGSGRSVTRKPYNQLSS